VESCVVCHDANRVSSTVMTSGIVDAGVGLNEAYQMKRMIHGIHGNSKRTTPFTHGNVVVGAFDKTGKLVTAGTFLADQKLTIGGVSTTVVPAGTPVAAGTTFAGIATIVDTAGRALGYTGTAVASAENYAAEVAYPTGGPQLRRLPRQWLLEAGPGHARRRGQQGKALRMPPTRTPGR
jgi:hypothetical protein